MTNIRKETEGSSQDISLFGKLIEWIDKRYIISDRAQRAAVATHSSGESFDFLYESMKQTNRKR